MNHPELGNHTCVARTAQGDLLTSDARGILPPLQWLRKDPAMLAGADVSDKVVGRAAALLFAYGNVRSIWAETMSDAAIDYLSGTDIFFEYGKQVDMIMNRDGTDMCPMERRALVISDPAEAFAVYDGVIQK